MGCMEFVVEGIYSPIGLEDRKDSPFLIGAGSVDPCGFFIPSPTHTHIFGGLSVAQVTKLHFYIIVLLLNSLQ